MQEEQSPESSNRQMHLQSLQTIVQNQARAFEQGDLAGFMRQFQLHLVSDYYTRHWFAGYACKVTQPDTCQATIERIHWDEQDRPITCTVVFSLYYQEYDAEVVRFHYTFGAADELRIVRSIVELQAGPWPDIPTTVFTIDPTTTVSIWSPLPVPSPQEWWQETEIQAIACTSSDMLKASLYARAIAKSTRYRMTHPEIDCAVLLSSMLSLRMATLAYALQKLDPVAFVQQINTIGQGTLTLKTHHDLRQGDLFPARELSLGPISSLDELLWLREQQPEAPVPAGCAEIAAFYIAQLRLYGFEPWNTLILTQPFHYLASFELPQGHYIISAHDILPMRAQRLHEDIEVTRIISPAFYIDQTGATNTSEALQRRLLHTLQARFPHFTFSTKRDAEMILAEDLEPLPSLRRAESPEQLVRELRKAIFLFSCRYPLSPFTWARYVHQTLWVAQPQAYIIWSLQAPTCRRFIQSYPSFQDALSWLREHLRPGSIFPEADRIMTADQVILYRSGTARERALVLYTLARLYAYCDAGGVILTTESSYAFLMRGNQQEFYDGQSLQRTQMPSGRICLAFDEQACYHPLCVPDSLVPRWFAFFERKAPHDRGALSL